MLRELRFSQCPLEFLAEKWGLDQNSAEFGEKLLGIFQSFRRTDKKRNTSVFSPNSPPEITEKSFCGCMSFYEPFAHVDFMSNDSEIKKHGSENLKCVLKVYGNQIGTMFNMKTLFKKIIIFEKEI